jgi:tetratricopeptide (TPR) repeat protein
MKHHRDHRRHRRHRRDRRHRSAAIASLAILASVAGGSSVASASHVAAKATCSATEGQRLIDGGRYEAAIREFTCVIGARPTDVDGYRGRIEAQLLLDRFSDAVRDYASVTALVVPVHADAATTIHAGYADRLAVRPHDVAALTGASFARWWFFEYATAIHLLDDLFDVAPNDVYANLFRGSSRLLLGANPTTGVADLERAIALAPTSADVRFIVADAYTYGPTDPHRALEEGSRALAWGLDTPRVHAILASALLALDDVAEAATHIVRHIELVTTNVVAAQPLAAGSTAALDLVPGRTFDVPVVAHAGESIRITTSSRALEIADSIAVVIGPDGRAVMGGDDDKQYLAAFEWDADVTGTYRLLVTSFEGVGTGELLVKRD